MGEEQRERQREGGWENGKKGEKEAALEREREKERGGTHTGSRRKICLPQQRMGEGVGKTCPLKEQDRPFITFNSLFYNKKVGS